MNLFELFVKIGVDDQASGKLKDLGGKLGNGLKTAAKIGTAAVTAAAAGITALTTAAVNNYAEYEQLVGGVETLFGAGGKSIEEYAASVGKSVEDVKSEYKSLEFAQQSVMNGAADAYKTAGLSANEYMSTVTSFSAALISSLEGDTNTAAELADRAIIAMSDNANKMGTSMEMIQNAYQGFAKQNYTMLDNLKLGYGGTKTEMQRLIDDANKVREANGEMANLSIESFADIVVAIETMQDKMGISGTTAREAGTTIEGSVNAMKSAWANLVTGFADGSADIGGLIDNLVTTIVGDGTENNLGVIGNVLPAVETALGGIVKLIEGAAPKIIEILPGLIDRIVPTLISAATSLVDSVLDVLPGLLETVVKALNDNLPILAEAAISIIQSLVDGISENQEMLMETALETITYLATSLISMLPQIVQLGLDLIVSLANGITQSLPTLLPTVIGVIMELAKMLTDPATLTNILNAAMLLIQELSYGLVDAIPQLVQAALMIIENLCMFLLDPQNLATLLKMAFDIIVGIGTGLINAIPELLKSVTRIITGIIALFKDADWGKIGKDIVDGFKNGISKAWTSLQKWFKNLFGDLIGVAKRILGIASPSKVFKKLGSWTADGFGIGFEDEFAHVKDDMEDALNFDDASVGINASIRKVGAGAAGIDYGQSHAPAPQNVNVTVTIDNNANAMGLARALLPYLKIAEKEAYTY